jgi:hypothetical protein
MTAGRLRSMRNSPRLSLELWHANIETLFSCQDVPSDNGRAWISFDFEDAENFLSIVAGEHSYDRSPATTASSATLCAEERAWRYDIGSKTSTWSWATTS